MVLSSIFGSKLISGIVKKATGRGEGGILLELIKNHKVLTLGIVGLILIASVERIAFSHKVHIVLRSPVFERWYGTSEWEKSKRVLKKYNLLVGHGDDDHIRVYSIFNCLLQTLYTELSLVKGYTIINAPTNLVRRRFGGVNNLPPVGMIAKKGNPVFLKYGIHHLEAVNWEILMLMENTDNAFCYYPGNILIYSGAVRNLSDNEIAATIAHEIGHCVARHDSERYYTYCCYLLVAFLISYSLPSCLVGSFIAFLRAHAFLNRRRELEADRIALLLVALAGYNPRMAINAFCKDGFVSTSTSMYPSARKRAQELRKLMATAMALYRQAQ